MAIEIAPKAGVKIPFWLSLLFYLSLILLLVTISSYFALLYLKKTVSDKISNLEKEISLTKTPAEIFLEEKVKREKRRIDDFSLLINEHKFPSKIFGFSEGSFAETKNFGRLIHPKVQILNFSLDLKNSKITVSGRTESFLTLGQQLLIFQKESLIREVGLTGVSFGQGGGINFTLGFSFDPSVFK